MNVHPPRRFLRLRSRVSDAGRRAVFMAAALVTAALCGDPTLSAAQPLDPLQPAAKPPALVIHDADWRTPNPDDVLVIDTNKGRVVVELSPFAAAAHVERVRILARQHFYDGQSFFRVIPEFMAQTGDPKNDGTGGSSLPNLKGEFTFRRGSDVPFVRASSSPGAEVGFIGSLPVASQPEGLMSLTADGKVGAWGLYCPGVAGMARSEGPDSANSQFFLMRQTYPRLEKTYTAWGRVIAGQDVVLAIKAGEPVPPPQDRMERVRLLSDLPAAERPVVRVLDPASAPFKVLIDREQQARGADFSVCDIDIPVQIH